MCRCPSLIQIFIKNNNIQTITAKVGELMTQAESMRNTEKTPAGKSRREFFLLDISKKIVKMITRTFCNTALKFRLRDIGSSIHCEGKIKLMGTRNIKIGDKCKLTQYEIL